MTDLLRIPISINANLFGNPILVHNLERERRGLLPEDKRTNQEKQRCKIRRAPCGPLHGGQRTNHATATRISILISCGRRPRDASICLQLDPCLLNGELWPKLLLEIQYLVLTKDFINCDNGLLAVDKGYNVASVISATGN